MSKLLKKVSYLLLALGLCLNVIIVNSDIKNTENPVSNIISDFQFETDSTWLVMIYLDADVDYEWGPMDSVHELESGFIENSNVEVIFLLDRIDGADYSCEDWTETRLYRLRHDDDPHTIGSELIANWGERNMGDNATLREFVSWAQDNYPADKSALVLFNHGGALSGICWDWSSYHDHLTLDEVQQGMTGLHVDLVVAEACSMSYLEVAYEWRTFADYFAASEFSVVIEAYDYQNVLTELCANPSMEPWTLGELFGEKYVEGIPNSVFKTFSVINCSSLEKVKNELDILGTKLLSVLPSNITLISNLRREMNSLTMERDVDTGEMIEILKNGFTFNTSILSTLNSLELAYKEAVLYNTTDQTYYNFATGLGIFFPIDNETVFNWRDYFDHELSGDLTGLDFAQDTSWDEFIAEYVEIGPIQDPLYEVNVHDDELLELNQEYDIEMLYNETEIYFYRVMEAGTYNITLEIESGDPALSLENMEGNYALFTEFQFSNLRNPQQGNIEQISVPMKTGYIIVLIGSLTYFSDVTLTIVKSPAKAITLGQEVTGEFPPADGINPPNSVYSQYAIELEAGSYIIEIDIDYPAGIEVFIDSSTGYRYLEYRYGILGMDFKYNLNTTLLQTITIYFGSYAGSSEYTLKIRNAVEEKVSLSFIFSILAIPTIYIIAKQRKK